MNFTVPIECSEGHQYLLKFKDCRNLPIELDIEVVDITLSLTSELSEINNPKTLNKITSVIFNFLEDNDVILYFYCSRDSIIQRQNRKELLSPQHYRSYLFSTMFEKATRNYENSSFVNKSVILKDELEGDHYLHLIAKNKYSHKIGTLSEQIENNLGK